MRKRPVRGEFVARVCAGVLATFAAGCWGLPRLAVRGDATTPQRFLFSYCGDPGRAPQLQRIEVSALAPDAAASETPVCALKLAPGAGTTPLPAWSYGTALPNMTPIACPALTPGTKYRVSVFGGGVGSEVFTAEAGGALRAAGESCSGR